MNARKILMLLTVTMLVNVAVKAQSGHYCPSDAINDTLLNNDPVFSRSFMYMEHVLRERELQDEAERSDDIYVLPVVVHVIHNGEPYGTGTNITDEQIFSAIEAMNDDFRKVAGTNGDGAGVDVGIEFCLASRDPNGNPTNGIVRVNGSSVANYSTMGIEASGGNGAIEESVKALSTWPRASYMNIWVVNEIENNDGGSGIQGYAYFPINNPIDGIVVLFNAFGTVGNLKSYTNMNRVITHETGHYLGLYHTFNGTSNCNAESDCSTQGDRVCDTPVTIQSTSCSVPACSGTQQVENYMDYTSQTCQDMFTAGQKLRMRTTLETQRTSMISSLGCMPVFTNDIGITEVLNPSGTNCQGPITPEVKLTNFGSVTLTSASIHYNVDGTGNNIYNWTGSLASGSSVTFALNTITPATGSHTFYAWTSSPNGTTDQNTANDQSTGSFAISTGSPLTLDVVLDYYGMETTWVITDANSFEIMNGGPYINGQQGLHNYTSVCLADGCYTLTMIDAYGDGQGFTNGSFSLTSSTGTVMASGAGNWGDFSNNPFCVTNAAPSGNPPVASFTIQDNTLCKNVQNDYTSTSTNSPTSYSWVFEGGTPSSSTSQNPQNITYATAGTYDVTLTATNSYGSHTYTCNNCITVYNDPTVTLTGNNPLCAGQNNGSVTNSVTGASPFTYSWSTGATSANLSNVGAGSYTVTVTDVNTCTKQASATLTSPTAMSVTGTVTNPTCSGINNGSITANATGGTGTKTYSWSNGATGATASNLAPGNYTVTVLDANNCSATQSFTITAPAALTVTGTTTQPTCSGLNNGSITASATGGTGSKTYSWSNGATGATASNLAPGNYTVTVLDANNCSATQSFTITAPAAMTVTGTTTQPACSGLNNGSITANASGGTGSKTYSWSNGATGATASNLAPGNYTVTVLDANNCSATQSFTITAPAAITITGTTTQPTCLGMNNGSITASATGGTGSKTYSWSNGAIGATASNLVAGNYTVTVLDANNCSATQSFTITAPAALTITGTTTQPTCLGLNNGSITASATGGTGTLTYTWNTGATGATLNNAVAGTYTVTVSDAAGCSQSQNFTLTAPAAMTITGTTTQPTCLGLNNGSITASATGGSGIMTYTWNTGATGTALNSVGAGTFTVTVSDAAGCSQSQNFTLTAPAAMSITGTTVNPTCTGLNNGSITASVAGGTGNKTYTWSNGVTGTTASNLAAGNYTVTVSDENGCSQTQSFTLTAPVAMTITGTTTPPICGNNNGSIVLNVSGGTGNKTYSWNNGATTSSISNLASGSYTVTVTDANGCSQTQTFTLTSPASFSVNGSVIAPTCWNSANGIISVSATGGSGNISYSWSNGTTGAIISNATTGNYTVTATDANGCSDSETFTVVAPAQMILNPEVTNLTCFGNATGSITLNVTGGTGNKTYFWNNGATTSSISNLNAGSYSVIVTDQSGCVASQNITVTSPAVLHANLNDFDIACTDEFGSAMVSPTGGQSPYNVLWSTGSTSNSIGSLSAGSYSVQVTDANGCSASGNFEITQSANLSVFANPTHVSCFGMNNGAINLNVNGGDQNYTYFWNNGSTAATLNGLAPGTYSVVVTDGNGCNGSTNVTITQPAAMVLEIDGEDVSCFGLSDGIATAGANGGTAPYTYAWDNGQTGQYVDELEAGSYFVTVSDANGCTVQGLVNIEEPDMLVANVIILAPETCAGNNGSAELLIEGGSPGYFILWNNGDTENILSGAAAGMYEVAVVDAHGCLLNLSAEIPYECEVDIPQTQLSDADCNSADVALNAIVTCDEVPGASMYQWRFSTTTGIVISDEYSLGNMFYVSQIPGLLENTTYVVGIKALVNGNWSAFGEFCSITTINIPDNDVPGLIAEDCGSTILSWGQTITSVQVPGAANYQWHITGENYDWTTYTEEHTLTIEENMQLVAGESYAVQMRCALGNGNFTDWGSVCEFTIMLTINIDESSLVPGFLSIYPNPSDGERIYFDFGNLRSDIVAENIMLFGPAGNLIESFNINMTTGTNRKHEHQFKNKLASGMYVLTYELNGRQRETKLLVK